MGLFGRTLALTIAICLLGRGTVVTCLIVGITIFATWTAVAITVFAPAALPSAITESATAVLAIAITTFTLRLTISPLAALLAVAILVGVLWALALLRLIAFVLRAGLLGRRCGRWCDIARRGLGRLWLGSGRGSWLRCRCSDHGGADHGRCGCGRCLWGGFLLCDLLFRSWLLGGGWL